MNIYACTYAHICMNICIYTYMQVNTHMCIYMYMYLRFYNLPSSFTSLTKVSFIVAPWGHGDRALAGGCREGITAVILFISTLYFAYAKGWKYKAGSEPRNL